MFVLWVPSIEGKKIQTLLKTIRHAYALFKIQMLWAMIFFLHSELRLQPF